MTSLSPAQLLVELEQLAKAPSPEFFADTELRTKLYHATKKAALALEQPTEVVVRLLLAHPVESTVIKIALKLELFFKIGDVPQSQEALVASTGADSVLLKRLLSALVAFGAVRRSSDGLFALSPSFRSLADPTFGHAVVNCSNFLNPTYQALPELLESTGYRNPDDPKNTAVQKAFGAPDTDLLGILSKKPEAGMGFGRLMGTWGEGHALLQHLYPVQSLADTYNAAVSPVMFVDVGGGYGQKAIALKNDFPDLPGKIIVQDLPMTIDRAPKVDGIDFAVHDFFTEQPIKGAKVYYIRQCLHNWPDDVCIKILRQLGSSMKQGYSKLLIHEQIMPETGAGEWVTLQDVNMMSLCGVAERTEKNWRSIIEAADLMISKVYMSKDGISESILETERR